MGSFIVTPLLLETMFGYSATTTSLITLCRTGSIVLAAPVASRLGRRFGERPILIVAASAIAGSMVLLALGAWNGSVTVVVGALLLGGWAWGHGQPAMVAVMANSVEQSDFGVATSLQQTATQMGSVLSIGLLTAIVADATSRGPYAEAYLMTAAFAVVGTGVATRLRPSERLVATALVGEDEMEPLVVVEEQFTPRTGST
jgi:MFS family permease